MTYASIDIETTGLDRENDQILSIGVVIEDSNNLVPLEELPKIHIAIVHERLSGSLFALNLNKNLIENILKFKQCRTEIQRDEFSALTNTIYLKEEEVCEVLFRFFFDNGFTPDKYDSLKSSIMHNTIDGKKYPLISKNITKTYLNVAGKNFGTFDKVFLEKLPKWKLLFSIRSRIIDPAILFTNWRVDESLPGLDACKERASLEGVVSHNAVEDAMDVVKLLRTQYNLNRY